MNDQYEELREKYLGCMQEIKYRTAVIDGFLQGEWHAGFVPSTAESVALQFRKTLELIALASLVANREEYAKQRANFASDWNAKRIVEVLERVNPRFYPEPSNSEPLGDEHLADYNLQPVTDYLTRDDFILLFDQCSDLLHAANPYAEDQPQEGQHEEFLGEAPNWRRRVISLLNHHQIHPLDTDTMFIVQMGGPDELPSLTWLSALD